MSTFIYPNATQGLETWVITITSFNLLAALLVACLVLRDNRHTGMSCWKLLPERRTPIYLAVSIFVSNVIFCVREAEGMIALRPAPNGETESGIMPSCAAFNEGSWWGIWFPVLVLTLRLCFMAGGVILKRNPWSKRSEMTYVVLVVVVSIPLWIPSHVLNPTPCSSIVMLFSPDSNSRLGLAGLVILIAFFALIGISMIIVVWDTTGSGASPRSSYDVEFDPWELAGQPCLPSSIEQALAKRTTVYYGVGLCCQYACILPNFGMIAMSHSSTIVVYLSSIFIHTTGIVLLLQYLFLRNPICPHCHLSRQRQPNVPVSPTVIHRRGILRRSRHPNTEKNRNDKDTGRPYTSGGGGEYQSLPPRESLQTSSDDIFKNDTTISGPRFPERIPGLETRPRSMQDATAQNHLGVIRERTGSCIITSMPLSPESKSPIVTRDFANVSQRPHSESSALDRLAESQNTTERLRYSDRLTKTEVQGKFEPSTSTSGNLSPHTNRIQSLYPISIEALNLPKATEEPVMTTEENPV